MAFRAYVLVKVEWNQIENTENFGSALALNWLAEQQLQKDFFPRINQRTHSASMESIHSSECVSVCFEHSERLHIIGSSKRYVGLIHTHMWAIRVFRVPCTIQLKWIVVVSIQPSVSMKFPSEWYVGTNYSIATRALGLLFRLVYWKYFCYVNGLNWYTNSLCFLLLFFFCVCPCV